MGGGLMQLVAYGAQDIYLTGSPQITFFKVIYRRYTNFACESIKQTINGSVDFGNSVSATISRNGDLIHKMHLEVNLPALNQTQGSGTYQGWCNGVGNALLKTVELEIGGQRIDKHYAEWLDIWGELTTPASKRDCYKSMVGNYDSEKSLESNADSTTQLHVPLQFWFNRNPGLALPLIALQYHEVKVNIEFRAAAGLTVSDAAAAISTPQNSAGSTAAVTSANLWVDYVYLDTDERRRFAQVSHEYLIEQLQFTGDESIASGTTSTNSRLNFNHPVKELVWVMVDTAHGANNSNSGNKWFKYNTDANAEPMSNTAGQGAKLQLNGQDRFAVRPGRYFRTVQPMCHHTSCPSKHIYCYSFALKPEDHQPSGTCNFSRIDNATLSLDHVDNACKLKVFAVNYNVLRIMGGMGGMSYSN